MPPCCPCNANGVGIRCKKCVCAKSARACSNCAPGRSDPCQCQNRPLPVASTPSLSLPLSYSAAATPPRPSSRSAPASPGRPETSEENPNTVVSVEQSTSTAIFQPQSRPAGTTPTSQPRCTGTPRTPSTTNRRSDLPEDFQDDTSQVESSDILFPAAALGGAHPNDSSAAEIDIDAKLEEVYGEPILNESEQPRTDPWYARWEKTVRLSFRRYHLPNGNVGRKFVETLAKEIDLVAEKKTNSERLIVYQVLILQREALVSKSADVRRLIGKRLEMWEDGLYDALMHDAERCDRTFGHGNNARRQEQECAHTERIFHRLMIEGKVRSTVRWITERGAWRPSESDRRHYS